MIITFVVIWAALGIATLALALYRKFLSMRENDYIYLGAGEEVHIPEQVNLAQRMGRIDRWGKTMTVVTIAAGLCLAAMYVYEQWHRGLGA